MQTKTSGSIVPVLLSGGTGTRLWPLSREAYPKQLLPVIGERSMLQETALRAADRNLFAQPVVIANAEHRFVIGEQLHALGMHARIVLEPAGRNTAPAAVVAALLAERENPDALVLLMPADHVVRDVATFLDKVRAGADAARAGAFVLFGMKPDQPATGYGYIRVGEEIAGHAGVHKVSRFAEKPDGATAEGFLASGDYVWNSGIFLLHAKTFIAEAERLQPEIVKASRAALDGAASDMDFLRLDPESFEAQPSVSIDVGIMEKTDRALVVPADFGWADVGSWSALWDLGDKDADGNVLAGDVVAQGSRGSYIRNEEGPLVAALGVEDLVIVSTPDVVMVARKDRDQEVKDLVATLRLNGHASATQTHKVHRPWGFYQSIHDGDRFQVKRITVNPGAKLSLQKHFHRAEHWVVVNGTALVTRDEEKILVRENESLFLPLGCVHRLENPGKLPLNLIEVQSGPYLGEDDIVRIEDIYARS